MVLGTITHGNVFDIGTKISSCCKNETFVENNEKYEDDIKDIYYLFNFLILFKNCKYHYINWVFF